MIYGTTIAYNPRLTLPFRNFSQSVESILTAKSFARNIPGLVQSLSAQEKCKFLSLDTLYMLGFYQFH